MRTFKPSPFTIAALLVLVSSLNLDCYSASADEPHERWLRYLAGHWEFKLDDERTGDVTWRRAGKTRALIFSGEADDFSIAGVIGWRAGSKKLVETDYLTNRQVHTSIDREFSMITDEKISGRQTFHLADGTKVTEQLEYRRAGDDTMTLTGTREDGTNWIVRFKRKIPDRS